MLAIRACISRAAEVVLASLHTHTGQNDESSSDSRGGRCGGLHRAVRIKTRACDWTVGGKGGRDWRSWRVGAGEGTEEEEVGGKRSRTPWPGGAASCKESHSWGIS